MGWLRGIGDCFLISCWPSPAVMRKRPIGFRHTVGVLALLDGVSPAVGRVEQLRREPLRHRLFVPLPRGRDDPADAEGLPSRGTHLDGHLVGRPANAARAYFDRGHD